MLRMGICDLVLLLFYIRAGILEQSMGAMAGLYDNSVPTRFLAPIDCSKIPALFVINAYH